MKKIEINCDMCEADLRHTSYASEYYLTLGPTPKSNPTNMAYAMALEPPINRDHHFCGTACLSGWLDKRQAQRKET